MAYTFVSKITGERREFETRKELDAFLKKRREKQKEEQRKKRERERLLKEEGVRGEIQQFQSERGTKTVTRVTKVATGETTTTVAREGKVIQGEQPTKAQVTGTDPKREQVTVQLTPERQQEVLQQNIRTIRQIRDVSKIKDPLVDIQARTTRAELVGTPLSRANLFVSRTFQPRVGGAELLKLKSEVTKVQKEKIKQQREEAKGFEKVVRGAQLGIKSAEQAALGVGIGVTERITREPVSVGGDIAIGFALGAGFKALKVGGEALAVALPKVEKARPVVQKVGAFASKAALPIFGTLTAAEVIRAEGGLTEKFQVLGKTGVRLVSFGIGAEAAKPFASKLAQKAFDIKIEGQFKRAPKFKFDPARTTLEPTGEFLKVTTPRGTFERVQTRVVPRGQIAIGSEGRLETGLRQLGLDPARRVQQLKSPLLAEVKPSLGTGRIDPTVQLKLTGKQFLQIKAPLKEPIFFRDPIARLESGQAITRPQLRLIVDVKQEKLGESILRSRGIKIIPSKKGQIGILDLEKSLKDAFAKSSSLFQFSPKGQIPKSKLPTVKLDTLTFLTPEVKAAGVLSRLEILQKDKLIRQQRAFAFLTTKNVLELTPINVLTLKKKAFLEKAAVATAKKKAKARAALRLKAKAIPQTISQLILKPKQELMAQTILEPLKKERQLFPTGFYPFKFDRPIDFPELEEPKDSRRKGFTLEIRREGFFKPVRAGLGTVKQAGLIGKDIVQTTAAASLRVRDPKGKVVEDLIIPGFIRSKKERGVFIEPKEKRIKSFGELKEITFKGIAAQKKRR